MNEQSASHQRFAEIVEETIEQINSLSKLKGGEYAGDTNRLANFKRNAQNLGVRPETIWAVYAGKHWDAISQYCKDQQAGKARVRGEPISGRLDDLIVYAILFKLMLEEFPAHEKPTPLASAAVVPAHVCWSCKKLTADDHIICDNCVVSQEGKQS